MGSGWEAKQRKGCHVPLSPLTQRRNSAPTFEPRFAAERRNWSSVVDARACIRVTRENAGRHVDLGPRTNITSGYGEERGERKDREPEWQDGLANEWGVLEGEEQEDEGETH